MKTSRRQSLILGVVSAVLAPCFGRGQDVVILDGLHVDLRVVDRPAAEPRLGLILRETDTGTGHETTNAVLHVPDAARFELPQGFEVFGPEGSPLWILPASQEPALLFLGISAAGITPGVFDPQFRIELARVEGTGAFFLWQFDNGGNLVVRMNSLDGVTAADSVSPTTGGHEHYFWGINATGITDVYLRVSNQLVASGETVTSDEIRVRFGVEPYTITEPAVPATLGMPAVSGGRVRVRLTGSPNREYRIETSPNLGTWTPAGSVTTEADGGAVADLDAGTDRLFLRAIGP